MKKMMLVLLRAWIIFGLVSCKTDISEETVIQRTEFGKLIDGEQIVLFSLKNKNGMEAKIINYGATVVSLTAPDRKGNFEDIVLGYDDIEGYVNGNSYFGGIVGRYGNRISKGKISIDGKEYQLAQNNGENHLHGGIEGFNKKVWSVDKTELTENGPAVTMTYISQEGEENYPGTVKLTVVYTLTNDNSLSIVYEGTTDKTTVLNPTNHSYFNLTGNMNKTILEHELTINAEKYTPVDKGLITTGALLEVENTPMDFRKPHVIGKDIDIDFEQLKYGDGYDHNWVLNDYKGKVRSAAYLYEPTSGRLLEVLTDEPGIQFYSGNFLDGTVVGKGGIKYLKRTGLCLETQHFPDSPNKKQFPSTLLKPGEIYSQTTIYKFSVK